MSKHPFERNRTPHVLAMLSILKDKAHTLVWYETRRVEIHGTSLTDKPV